MNANDLIDSFVMTLEWAREILFGEYELEFENTTRPGTQVTLDIEFNPFWAKIIDPNHLAEMEIKANCIKRIDAVLKSFIEFKSK